MSELPLSEKTSSWENRISEEVFQLLMLSPLTQKEIFAALKNVEKRIRSLPVKTAYPRIRPRR